MIEAIIFDIDGTLVDSVDLHAHAWQDAFEKFGKTIEFEAIRNQIGKGGDQLLPTFLSKTEIEQFGEELTKFRGEHFKDNYLNKVKPFPKVRQLFEKVKNNGKKIAIGSSAHKEELDYYLKLCNIIDLVDVKTSADDADKSKPHPDIFEAALSKLAVSTEKAVVIGDSPYDADAARKINLRSIGVLCGGFPREILEQAGAMAIFDSPSDILNQYDQSPLTK